MQNKVCVSCEGSFYTLTEPKMKGLIQLEHLSIRHQLNSHSPADVSIPIQSIKFVLFKACSVVAFENGRLKMMTTPVTFGFRNRD